MRKAGTRQPLALRRREVFALVHAAASPHRLAARNVALVQLRTESPRHPSQCDRPPGVARLFGHAP
jgi:hypothetical protein